MGVQPLETLCAFFGPAWQRLPSDDQPAGSFSFLPRKRGHDLRGWGGGREDRGLLKPCSPLRDRSVVTEPHPWLNAGGGQVHRDISSAQLSPITVSFEHGLIYPTAPPFFSSGGTQTLCLTEGGSHADPGERAVCPCSDGFSTLRTSTVRGEDSAGPRPPGHSSRRCLELTLFITQDDA